MKRVNGSYAGFDLEVGETVRLQRLGPKDVIDKQSDLIRYRTMPNMLEAIGCWHGSSVGSRASSADIYRICDTGDTAVVVIKSRNNEYSDGQPGYRYDVRWLDREPPTGVTEA